MLKMDDVCDIIKKIADLSKRGLKIMTATIKKAIEELKSKQKVFHSEADFQFSLAWELQKILPDAKIRLEYSPIFDGDMHIDIYIVDGEKSYPIELKYKTRKIIQIIDGEQYNLKNQSAQDIGRFDFLYDINRIEKVKALDRKFASGYAIILTNDSAYWKVPSVGNAVDAAFRIHEGKTVTGNLSWAENAGVGTTKGRDPFELYGEYRMTWLPYSTINANYGEFKYCLIEVI